MNYKELYRQQFDGMEDERNIPRIKKSKESADAFLDLTKADQNEVFRFNVYCPEDDCFCFGNEKGDKAIEVIFDFDFTPNIFPVLYTYMTVEDLIEFMMVNPYKDLRIIINEI